MPAAGPRSPVPVSAASAGKAISTLRLRLAIEGDLGKAEGGDPADLTAGMFSQKWGPDLTAAVKALPGAPRPQGQRASWRARR